MIEHVLIVIDRFHEIYAIQIQSDEYVTISVELELHHLYGSE